jgi:hypothetical protein
MTSLIPELVRFQILLIWSHCYDLDAAVIDALKAMYMSKRFPFLYLPKPWAVMLAE